MTEKILNQITCPHCWSQFHPKDLLWISEHQELLGDVRLGADAAVRFLPTRFNPEGHALDAMGFPCRHLACPRCHLKVPRSLLEVPPLFLSIFGAPASGKSYLLASMVGTLRKTLPHFFQITMEDADPEANLALVQNEYNLFSHERPEEYTLLNQLISKTFTEGDQYSTIAFGTHEVVYAQPYFLNIRPRPEHPNYARLEKLRRTIVLYDNAGEHFQPGRDSAQTPVTRHMALSSALFYVFDPLQDSRFRQRLKSELQDVNLALPPGGQSQISVLQEAFLRIRNLRGGSRSQKHDKPLIIIVTKMDLWWHLLQLGDQLPADPWRRVKSESAVGNGSTRLAALDLALVEQMSDATRRMLMETNSDMVYAAEDLAERCLWLPVSAVGWNVSVDQENHNLLVRPDQIEPYWVSAPFVWALYQCIPGLIPTLSH